MPLPAPSYIPVADLASHPITYPWNDKDPNAPLEWPDETVKQSLARLSNFAIIGFSLGCAEWVVYRLKDMTSDPLPFQYVEALWLLLMGRINASGRCG